MIHIMKSKKYIFSKVSKQLEKVKPTFNVEKHLCQENLYNRIFDENKSSANLHFPIFAQLLKLPRSMGTSKIPPRDIHIECSKQFKWNLYFYVSEQSGPFWAVLKLL